MSFAIEVLIQAPIERVFDYVKDTFISVQKIGKKVFEAKVEFLEYEAPYISTLGGEMKQGYSTTTYVLEEEEKGTFLTLILEHTPIDTPTPKGAS